ncbi:biopolymer transport protein ExbB/TolQ [Enterococcus rotai]|uniref:hypothetical protein n=1 Tax=Enterococcus rotai TaxID=118060 RepID=UPI003395DE02
MKKLTKKQLGLIAAVVVLGVGGTYAYTQNQSSVKASEAKQEVKATMEKLEDLNKEVATLYDKKDPDFLVKGIKAKQITDLQEKETQVATIKKDKELSKKDYAAYEQEVKSVKGNLTSATKKLDALVDINSLFQQTQTAVAINGSDVKKDLAIVDDLKKETVEKVSKAFFKEGATKTYDKTINELLANAENQLNQIDKAKSEVAKVYKDGKVVSTDNKLYDTAKTETDKVKNEKAKKALNDQLDKVKADMDKKAAEEAKGQEEIKQENGTPQQQAKTPEDRETLEATQTLQEQTDQGQTTTDYTGLGGAPGTGDYVPQGGNGNPQPQAPQAQTPPPAGGNGRGEMTQDDLNQASKDAATSDPTKDPNSPWFKP